MYIGKLNLSEALPKICVSLIAGNREDLLMQAIELKKTPIDLVEWRVDFFENFEDLGEVVGTLGVLRGILQEIPLIFTYRTKAEGGKGTLDRASYLLILQEVLLSGQVDLIDIEYQMVTSEPEFLKDFQSEANRKGIRTIVSMHDFEKTPDDQSLKAWVDKLKLTGADIIKLAVMANSKQDVVRLMAISIYEKETAENTMPMIFISMGPLGVATRIMAEYMGSCITFASLLEGSAPGQLSISDTKVLTSKVHEYIGFEN